MLECVVLAGGLWFAGAINPPTANANADLDRFTCDVVAATTPAVPAMPRSLVPDPTVTTTVNDTVRRKRVVAVEYSDWYSRRLTIHRWASYLTLPLFAGNYVTGSQLLKSGNQAPRWAIDTHGPLATGVTALFVVNTVTGGWNLWAGRNDPAGRGWRTAHALLMLTADAGFTATGILSTKAKRSDQLRRLHRDIALGSISTAVVSYVMMLSPFRHD